MIDDQLLLEQLAATDAYAPDTPLPAEAWTRDVALAEIERRVGMQTEDRIQHRPPQARTARGWLVAAATFVAVLVIGSAMLFWLTRSEGPEVVDEPTTTTIPTTTAPPPTTAAPSPLSLPDTWQRVGAQVMNPAVGLFDMALTESGLVAVGFDPGNEDYRQNGAILTSPDGVSWTRQAEDAPELNLGAILIYGVTEGGPGIVAVGMGCEDDAEPCMAYPTVWTSVDGTEWSRSAADPEIFGPLGAMMDAISSEHGIVAAGGSYDESDLESLPIQPTVWLSGDGTSWERVWRGETFGAADATLTAGFHALTSNADGLLVGVGMASNSQGDFVAAVWTSTDGRSWERIGADSAVFASNSDAEVVMHDVAWGPGGFVAVGTDGGTNVAIWHSPDGLDWTRADTADQPFEHIGTLSSVDALGMGWVAVGPHGFSDMAGGTMTLWTSSDGLNWDRVHWTDPGYGMAVVAMDSGVAVAGGFIGTDNFHAAVWAGPAFDPAAPPTDPGPAPALVQEPASPIPDEGLSCEELVDLGYEYLETVSYWAFYERPSELDPDGNGAPCENYYPADQVAEVVGGAEKFAVEVVYDWGPSTFTATGPGVDSGHICSSGTVEGLGDAEPHPAAFWSWQDLYTCDDGSGTFTLATNGIIEDGQQWAGVWYIVSGTGSYVNLAGGGPATAVYVDEADVSAGWVWPAPEEE